MTSAATIRRRLDEMEARLDELDARLDAIGRGIQALQELAGNNGDRLAAITKQIADLGARHRQAREA